MNPDHEELLALALDDEAPEAERRAAEERLAADPEGRRLLAEHRALWDLLGELDVPAEGLGDGAFAAAVGRRARGHERRAARFRIVRGAGPALAASLLVTLAALGWFGRRAWAEERDAQLVRYLHLVEHAELVDTHATALDLRNAYELRRAFQGELDER